MLKIADMIDFLDIFLDEEFYNMIKTQTNLYTSHFHENIPFSPDIQELEIGKMLLMMKWDNLLLCKF